jgi:hypothetical protein
MKRKTMLLVGAALSVLAFTALPSMASAFESTPSIDPVAPAEFPLSYSGAGGAGTLYTASGRNINCTGNSASGSFASSMTGTAKVTFTGCTENKLGSQCQSGATKGTIVTEELTTHTVYLSGGKPGVLFTPNESGKFATISCLSGFIKIEVKGSGVLGTVTEPGFGEEEASNSFEIVVKATSEGQEHTETAEGETYGLESNLNGGGFEPAYEQAGSTTATLNGGAEAITTE